jgi:hypothetical protein
MSAIKVMDLTHPLLGKTLKLLSEQCSRGKEFVAVGLKTAEDAKISNCSCSTIVPPAKQCQQNSNRVYLDFENTIFHRAGRLPARPLPSGCPPFWSNARRDRRPCSAPF